MYVFIILLLYFYVRTVHIIDGVAAFHHRPTDNQRVAGLSAYALLCHSASCLAARACSRGPLIIVMRGERSSRLAYVGNKRVAGFPFLSLWTSRCRSKTPATPSCSPSSNIATQASPRHSAITSASPVVLRLACGSQDMRPHQQSAHHRRAMWSPRRLHTWFRSTSLGPPFRDRQTMTTRRAGWCTNLLHVVLGSMAVKTLAH